MYDLVLTFPNLTTGMPLPVVFKLDVHHLMSLFVLLLKRTLYFILRIVSFP